MHISAGGTWALFRQESTPSCLLLSKTEYCTIVLYNCFEYCPVHHGKFLQSGELSNVPKTLIILIASFQCPSSQISQSGRITKNILMLFNPQSRGFAYQTSSVDKNVLSKYMCPFNKSMIAKCFDTLYNHGYFFKFMYDQDNKRIEQLHFIYFS